MCCPAGNGLGVWWRYLLKWMEGNPFFFYFSLFREKSDRPGSIADGCTGMDEVGGGSINQWLSNKRTVLSI